MYQSAVEAVSRRYPDIVVHEVNTDENHVHLLVSIPSRISVSKAVNIFKSNSAKAMRKRFPFLNKMYHNEGVA